MPVQTNRKAGSAAIFLCCTLLASCSSSQHAFFAQIDTLISQGYRWEKLDKCRPAKKDTLTIPIIVSDGRKLVCYTLVPPQHGGAVSLPAADKSQTAPSNRKPATTTPNETTITTTTTTSALSAHPPADSSGIIWNFSNF